jgi:hypothetical protein
MPIDIRTLPSHDNAGYSYDADSLVVIFDYLDRFGDPDNPTPMLAYLYPNGLASAEPAYCEHGHDIAPGQPLVDIPDRTTCIMCPDHFSAHRSD